MSIVGIWSVFSVNKTLVSHSYCCSLSLSHCNLCRRYNLQRMACVSVCKCQSFSLFRSDWKKMFVNRL